ncbi:MAG: glutamine synthetase III [Oscillospiraceae bacterium]|jgi:glutamine synthetase|nr:glutamine synthetase III [Oscillospiraceae bacterium]
MGETCKPVRIQDLFGSMVFGDEVMKRRLPHDTYKAFKKTLAKGQPLDRTIADVVASAMKDWAIEKGATHYTHWFQPMTGITAEKHESFISDDGDGIIMEFSGKQLIKGEPDASSFPSGGLRATFEARGYTAWDPTSYAFIKDGVLCIPTAFCSHNGQALDKKTPLLRSMEALNVQAKRILKLFGKDPLRVTTTVGPEQEYFLIDQKMYDARPDLIYTGRTLFGAKSPKGQELDDHYFGALKGRVSAFMKELDRELWKLGVMSKTEHNEVAPGQHELAPIFGSTNVATDHNQLTMELMKKVAARNGMACLLHEKPFAGVNGSGKHNNWSMSTDDGHNLLEPGNNPIDNAQFLLFLSAVIKAVDEHQDLLRISVASAGNDHRFGANEAPPTIVSMFLGDELTAVLDALQAKVDYKADRTQMDIGVDILPRIPKDTTDRNRTSPFAFTGNKFEFRMLGSAFSVAGPNIVLNTIVAESLRQFADKLEAAEDFNTALNRLIRHTVRDHKRIIFNGNNYSDEWVVEAEKRGLLNWSNTPAALEHLADQHNIDLFEAHGVFTETEIHSRQEILEEGYTKVIRIEAMTMVDMARHDLLPAVLCYSDKLAEGAARKASIGVTNATEKAQCECLSGKAAEIAACIDALEAAIESAGECMYACRDQIIPAMAALRAAVDSAETMVARGAWPYPSYGEMFFSVR